MAQYKLNCCVYNRGVPVLSSLFTDDLRSNVLVSGPRKEISMKFGEDLPLFQMEENGWNLQTMELVFMGGASELLQRKITERFLGQSSTRMRCC